MEGRLVVMCNSKGTVAKFAILTVLILALVFTLCSCSKKLTGHWVCEDTIDNYPGSMTLESDGTGIVDGYTASWRTKGNTFTINLLVGAFSYEYELKGSTLYLDGSEYHKQ